MIIFPRLSTSKKSQGYWDLSSSQGKFYDTALALLAVSDAPETKAKNWLTQNQGSDGCWNSGNIRDTAILIWGGWPRTPIATTSAASCSDAPGFCMSSGECYDASGKVLANFACSGVQVCCDKQLVEKTCSEKSGIVCTSGKQCSSTEVSASDTSSCCLGTCVEPVTTTECEQNSYNCRASCLDEEEESTLSCESSKICCKPSTITSGGGSLWWLWILIILIILVVLAIIFRKRIQVWWFNRKNKGSESKVQASRPGFPPFSQLRPMMPRPQPSRPPAVRPAPRPVSRPQVKSKTDSELEATLRKLREMSK